MIGVPSRKNSEDSASGGDGNKNKDDLYLFTRGQVFKKSGRRSAPPRSFTFPMPSPGIMKLPPPSFMNYADSGFDTPGLMLSFPGHQDAFSASFPNHDNGHGYHSSSSTPGIASALIPSLDLFPLEGADQLPMFDSTTDGTAGGTDHAGSNSWLQSFGIPDGTSIGFSR
jgi:hypothetical protein